MAALYCSIFERISGRGKDHFCKRDVEHGALNFMENLKVMDAMLMCKLFA